MPSPVIPYIDPNAPPTTYSGAGELSEYTIPTVISEDNGQSTQMEEMNERKEGLQLENENRGISSLEKSITPIDGETTRGDSPEISEDAVKTYKGEQTPSNPLSMSNSSSQASINENEVTSHNESASQSRLQSAEELENTVNNTPDKGRRNSLLKKSSSFVTPSGEHIEPKKVGRRLSFSDESGAKLCETAFSDKLHYSGGHSFIQAAPIGGGRKPPANCCILS